MAVHQTEESMRIEALREYIEVAEYCINFDKSKTWPGFQGCYGYPAALLLLSIVDSIGKEIKGGGDDVFIHFNILNDPDWYSLNLSETQLKRLVRGFRHKLSHESYISKFLVLDIGSDESPVLDEMGSTITLYLKPFLDVSKKIVQKITSEHWKLELAK